jgi:hypothetical protein
MSSNPGGGAESRSGRASLNEAGEADRELLYQLFEDVGSLEVPFLAGVSQLAQDQNGRLVRRTGSGGGCSNAATAACEGGRPRRVEAQGAHSARAS